MFGGHPVALEAIVEHVGEVGCRAAYIPPSERRRCPSFSQVGSVDRAYEAGRREAESIASAELSVRQWQTGIAHDLGGHADGVLHDLAVVLELIFAVTGVSGFGRMKWASTIRSGRRRRRRQFRVCRDGHAGIDFSKRASTSASLGRPPRRKVAARPVGVIAAITRRDSSAASPSNLAIHDAFDRLRQRRRVAIFGQRHQRIGIGADQQAQRTWATPAAAASASPFGRCGSGRHKVAPSSSMRTMA